MQRRQFLAVTAAFGAMAALPAGAQDKKYPDRPITIIVPYGAGGTNDIVAREVAQKLQEMLGQPVVVDNKPGANGAIGTGLVARAAPDGYTIGIAPSSVLAINEWLHSDLPYNVEQDFAPLTLAGLSDNVLVVHPSVPANTVAEFIALAKAKPGSITYASMGVGSTGHLNGELLKTLAGIDLKHVPYKGSGPAMNDLLAGHVQAMFDNLPTSLPQIKAGKLRALGVASNEPSRFAPDVPAISKTVPQFEGTSWFGFIAPKATPAPIVALLSASMIKALKMPDVVARLETGGFEVIANKPAEFAAFIKAERTKWKSVIDKANVKIEK